MSAVLARRPLPVRAEVGRQVRRRRTRLLAVLLAVLPLLLVGAFALGDDDGDGAGFVDLATSSAGNFALFVLFATAGFLLGIVVALLAGDCVASEASWSTLRYLLAAPVPRARLLAVKLAVALASAALALALLLAASLLVGAAFYGWDDVRLLAGGTLDAWPAVGRLAIAAAYVFVQLLWVAGVAFYLGTLTDAPLGAVGGAVLALILSSILDSITALGDLREWLPTHDAFAWTGALAPVVEWDAMARGACTSLLYATVLVALAFRHFTRKDVLS